MVIFTVIEHRLLHCSAHVQLFVTPWTVAHQAPLSEFSRQEYWGGLPFLLQGIFLTQRLNLVSCIAGRFFTIWATREALMSTLLFKYVISPFKWMHIYKLHLNWKASEEVLTLIVSGLVYALFLLFIWLLNSCTFYQFSVSSLLMNKKGLRGKGVSVVLSFPLLLCHRFQHE